MSGFDELYKRFEEERKSIFCEIPSKKLSQEFTVEFMNFLFPVNLGCDVSKVESEAAYHDLKKKFSQLLQPIKKQLTQSVEDITRAFFNRIKDIYDLLLKDAVAFFRNDPAAQSLPEVIIAYPGFFAIVVYRLTHEMVKLKIPILPRLIAEYSHSQTGIDIHPGATIGESFFIDHGTGVVIGESAIIHNQVKIYQGVTLGALSVEKTMAQSKRHPTIEDNVVIYAGSTILGGNTIVGHDSIIGGNVWLTESVPPHSLVLNKSECIVKQKKHE